MIAIVDYDAGNLTSVARAMAHLGYDCDITKDETRIRNAERVIFPGVGAAGSAMASLRRLGLDRAIQDTFASGKPLLGICLGTQIIMEFSEEDGGTDCLGVVDGRTRLFSNKMTDAAGAHLKIPHMGWNRIRLSGSHPVLDGIADRDEFYFVHSYYPDPDHEDQVIGRTEHGIAFASVIGTANLIATQFHPEKSGRPGLTLLKNFCEWTPC